MVLITLSRGSYMELRNWGIKRGWSGGGTGKSCYGNRGGNVIMGRSDSGDVGRNRSVRPMAVELMYKTLRAGVYPVEVRHV